MKKYLFLVVSLFAVASQAETLLTCQLGAGALAEVKIVEEEGKLKIKELRLSGRQNIRDLPRSEWIKQRINLQSGEIGEKGVLYNTDDGWFYRYKGLGSEVFGTADCE